MKDVISYAVGLIGCVAVTVGVGMWSVPAGFVTFGALCLFQSWLIARMGE